MRNKIVLIHVDSLRREYLSSWLLGKKFGEKGFDVLLSSRHSTRRILRFFTPAIFISTHPFTVKFSELENLKKRGTKIYVNEVEGTDKQSGVSSTYPEFFLNEKINYDIFSGIFVWGKFSYKWLLENRNLNNQKLFLSGSIRQSKLVRPFKKKNNELVVGIISRFEIINVYDGRHPFSNLINLDPEDENWRWYFERFAIDSEAFSIAIKLTNKLIENGYKVSIRPHPNEKISTYNLLKQKYGSLFKIDSSYDINEWLNEVSVVVGPTSTAFTEAYLAGIPIISFSGIQKNKYSHYDRTSVMSEFDRAAFKPDTVDEAYRICTSLDLKPRTSEQLDRYFNKFFSLDKKEDPINFIVEHVEKNDFDKKITGFEKFLSFVMQFIFLSICDFLFIMKYIIKNPSFTTLDYLKQYNYNRLLHKPTIFMKEIKHQKLRK
ncbi:MAG: hypothetical protein ACJ0PU_02930 [Flavobacteriaceae bacterium]